MTDTSSAESGSGDPARIDSDVGASLAIGNVFHITQVVQELDHAVTWYKETFGARQLYRGFDSRAKRDGALLWFGDMIVEPMSPASVAGADNASVGRFLTRFGEGVFNVAWYAEDLEPIFDVLARAGIRLYGMDGAQLDGITAETDLATHPRDTPGQLEFAVPGYIDDPRLTEEWSMDPWMYEHPLTLIGTSHLTLAVADMTRSTALFCDVLGATILRDDEIETERSVLLRFGLGPPIELAMPMTGTGELAAALDARGDGFFGVTFKVRDLESARHHLTAAGTRVRSSRRRSFVLESTDTFNVRMAFTTAGPYGRF